MSRRVMTFSTRFPAYHPKAGESTWFVEKIMAGFADSVPDWTMTMDFVQWDWYKYYNATPKYHTIRAGKRWKVGDMMVPVIWGNDVNPKSGRTGPYHSKQLHFSPVDIEIKSTWDFDLRVHEGNLYGFINDNLIEESHAEQLAKNDGLSVSDMHAWFATKETLRKGFVGQIICWNENINYSSE